MSDKFRRMGKSDIAQVVNDLDRWASGQLGSKLTWAILENRFVFSRQSLQAKPEIKAAYIHAKNALSGGLVKSREQAYQENDALFREVERLKLEIRGYQNNELLWKERWQRIAYHIREKGVQLGAIDKPVLGEDKLPNEREITNILKLFDKNIPPTGRI